MGFIDEFGFFRRGALEQNTGVIAERWQQSGSNGFSATDSATSSGSPQTLHTVTAGKTAYLAVIIFQSDEASGSVSSGQIRDDATAKLNLQRDKANGSLIVEFKTPIAFTTSIVLHTPNNNDITATAVGWEE